MERELTASVYLIEDQKVLLIFHPKLQKWLPPGGHVELNETPCEAAKREVREETGLEFEFLFQPLLSIDYWNAKTLPRPYLCLLENIPTHQHKPAHQHIDFIYVAKPTGGKIHSFPLTPKWFSWKDLQLLEPDVEIFQETLEVVQDLFSFSFSTFDSFPSTVAAKDLSSSPSSSSSTSIMTSF